MPRKRRKPSQRRNGLAPFHPYYVPVPLQLPFHQQLTWFQSAPIHNFGNWQFPLMPVHAIPPLPLYSYMPLAAPQNSVMQVKPEEGIRLNEDGCEDDFDVNDNNGPDSEEEEINESDNDREHDIEINEGHNAGEENVVQINEDGDDDSEEDVVQANEHDDDDSEEDVALIDDNDDDSEEDYDSEHIEIYDDGEQEVQDENNDNDCEQEEFVQEHVQINATGDEAVQDNCTICLGPLTDEPTWKCSVCVNVSCYVCMDIWWEHAGNCPLCRTEIAVL